MLSDFGLSVILAELEGTPYLTPSMGGTIRYAAPEIYAFSEDSTNVRVTTRSDVYSFGSVTYQVSVCCSSHLVQVIILLFQTLSGQVPYHNIPRDCNVLWQLFKGIRPERPSNDWFTDDHWVFINKCWNKIPSERPTIQDVLSYLHFCFDKSSA